jgi:hypothetical protein
MADMSCRKAIAIETAEAIYVLLDDDILQAILLECVEFPAKSDAVVITCTPIVASSFPKLCALLW